MKNTNITYTQQGDYLLTDLKLLEQKKVKIGIFGQRHKIFLLIHHKIICCNLLISCKLAEYLADINMQETEIVNNGLIFI